MAVFKCKMCGASLDVSVGTTVLTCDYCGTTQTLPKLDNEKRLNLYDRANHFRRNNEYDKAMDIYEKVLNEDQTDAEAYWSLVLCRYGIEYVEDPATHKRIPTVNRTQFTSIFDDDNYKCAISYADATQKQVYEAEAKAINEIQKAILAVSKQEKPFDIFICYKETDHNGRRTPDSVLAQELYYQLTNEGFKVFFSRITLEDKLGSAYEPYIFAALNSAKVMVVLGTKEEYFKAVWVKNEWSRYLSLIKNGEEKTLIPAFRDMDPYDLPEEFSHLQAQDMSKLGFMQDLIRGIQKICGKNKQDKEYTTPQTAAPLDNREALLKRITIFLRDNDWQTADVYCEKVLDYDPENGKAYLYKLLAQANVSKIEHLKNFKKPLDKLSTFKNAVYYADEETKKALKDYNQAIKDEIARIEAERLERERIAREKEEARLEKLDSLGTQYKEKKKVFDSLKYQVAYEKEQINKLINEKKQLEDDIDDKRRMMNAYREEKERKVSKMSSFITVYIIMWVIMLLVSAATFASKDPAGAFVSIAAYIVCLVIGCIIANTINKPSGTAFFFNILTLGLYTMISTFTEKNKIKEENENQEFHVQCIIDKMRTRFEKIEQDIPKKSGLIRKLETDINGLDHELAALQQEIDNCQ